jgi:predicted  nucleic acid-binding Zn-ribbon protein
MVTDDIRALLAASAPAVSKTFLERVDVTLTDGYAHALQLEGERRRIEQRIADLVASAGSDGEQDPELAALAERLSAANENIAALRALLRSLRDRRAELRRAA